MLFIFILPAIIICTLIPCNNYVLHLLQYANLNILFVNLDLAAIINAYLLLRSSLGSAYSAMVPTYIGLCCYTFFKKNGPFPASFSFFRLSYTQFTVNKCSIKVAYEWIPTWVLSYQKRPLCQLRHIHCPCC